MARVRGKKGGKILEATMDGACKQNFSNLQATKSLLLVSIKGNDYCTGEYLQAMIEKSILNNGNVSVLVADEVYRHNLRTLSGLDDETALREEALQLGDEFFLSNIPYILKALSIGAEHFESACNSVDVNEKISWINDYAQKQGIVFELLRWHDWINRDNYLAQASEIEGLYESVDCLRESIEDTAHDFARRHQHDGSAALWLHRSSAYLKEESPAVMWCSMARGYEFIAYPGSIIASMETTKTFFLSNDLPEKARKFQLRLDPALIGHWLDVYFKRTHGHVVSNLSPKAHLFALEKVGIFKKAQVEEKESVDVLVTAAVKAILSDEKISSDLKIPTLISLLGEVLDMKQLSQDAQLKTM